MARLIDEPEFRRAFHARLKTYNPFVVTLYKIGLLPLFGAARTVMLLTTQGRRSGKLRQTPIGYFRIGGVIHLFSAWGKQASWYKNILAHPDQLGVQVGLRKLRVHAQIVDDPGEIQRTLEQFVTESPAAARTLLGWNPDFDQIAAADFSGIVQGVLIVRLVEV
jgi:deazaflavin-dependent oxidoreductase (nitroreductase family)